ncbi:unnamed protein product, partial [Gulo gulo]
PHLPHELSHVGGRRSNTPTERTPPGRRGRGPGLRCCARARTGAGPAAGQAGFGEVSASGLCFASLPCSTSGTRDRRGWPVPSACYFPR